MNTETHRVSWVVVWIGGVGVVWGVYVLLSYSRILPFEPRALFLPLPLADPGTLLLSMLCLLAGAWLISLRFLVSVRVSEEGLEYRTPLRRVFVRWSDVLSLHIRANYGGITIVRKTNHINIGYPIAGLSKLKDLLAREVRSRRGENAVQGREKVSGWNGTAAVFRVVAGAAGLRWARGKVAEARVR